MSKKFIGIFLSSLLMVFSQWSVSQNKINPPDKEIEVSDLGAIVFEEKESGGKRVVMGSHTIVESIESIGELVVVGGRVDVHGKVGKLVVVGGYLELHPGAQVTKELVIVGGLVKEHSGAMISADRVDISMPGNEAAWEALFKKIENSIFKTLEEKWWIPLIAFLFKVSVLFTFYLLGQALAPAYLKGVDAFLDGSLGSGFAWGLASVLLVLPLTLFLTLSLIGIPLLPLQFSLLFLFVIFGETQMAKYIGTRTLLIVPEFAQVLFGIIMIEAIGFVPVAGILKWVVILIGFGAASKVFYGKVMARH